MITPEASKAWNKLDPHVRRQAAQLLQARSRNPKVPSAALRGELAGAFKVKMANLGLRVVYVVRDDLPALLVIAVGERDKGKVYQDAARWMAANWPPLG